MKAIDLIRFAMKATEQWTAGLAADMADAALLQPTAHGGNHVMWTVGHIAFIEGGVLEILLGEKNPVADWARLFAPGTQPLTDAASYPPFSDVLGKFRELRGRNLRLLEEVGEAGLDRLPVAIPPGFEEEMKTFGRTFLVIALHQMQHHGQIAVARKAAGRKPLFL